MKTSDFKFQFSATLAGKASVFAALVLAAYCFVLSVPAHEGEDHSKDVKQTVDAPVSGANAVSIGTAERNIDQANGKFVLVLRRSPGDPRTAETELFLLKIKEKVEGGFGGGEPTPVENATLTAGITYANGDKVAEGIPVQVETGGIYRTSYAFGSAGDYKIVFSISTADNRQITADFPVTVLRTPIRTSFLIGMAILSLLTIGLLGELTYSAWRRADGNYKRIAALAIAAVLLFVFGTVALAFLLPPREIRAAAPISPDELNQTNSLAAKESLTLSKESQLLFGIKTEPVATRTITAGLNVTGTVKGKPDARAVVTPPVAGRIILRAGLTLGSAVGRGEQIGYVEQILDVSGQVGLEQQRLEVETQQREVEARRLELKNSVLRLQAQQADQSANAQKAKTQLAQAERELRRSENLVEVNAVPKKRLEEARTAVKIAEQSVASAEKQVSLIDAQIKQARAGQDILRSPRVKLPTTTFPLISPVTGTINEIKATSGQQVESGTEILSIINLNIVLIEAQVFERDLPVVRDSTRASFTTAALSGEVYSIGTPDGDGRLVSIGQAVDPLTRTVPIIYEVVNPLNRLRDGMFVEITIDTSGNREVLAVPKQAVIIEQGQTFVFVFEGGETFEKRLVSLGAEGADYHEVRSGLKEGERVVTGGLYQLRSTQPES